ncbi:hypothetical protein PR048_003917 [Dryococelus australis]|uniref:Uncharacterized protein n=1 Tax=Dryococelus australis TaxID=614101 RepID=A0ABQ9IPF2_9NEOP|nr:hypothetical protein PR048_003917 [Dryococelus australis]
MRVIEVSMEQRRNESGRETRDPRENPLTSRIVGHDSHLRKSGTGLKRPRWCSGQSLTNRVRFPAGLFPYFACGNRAGRCNWSAGFLGDFPFSPLLHSSTAPYSPRFTLMDSQDLDVKSPKDRKSCEETCIAAERDWTAMASDWGHDYLPEWENGVAPECKGGGKREIPEKTCRSATSSDKIPTCENPGVTRPGIELGSPWWEASMPTAQPQQPHVPLAGKVLSLAVIGTVQHAALFAARGAAVTRRECATGQTRGACFQLKKKGSQREESVAKPVRMWQQVQGINSPHHPTLAGATPAEKASFPLQRGYYPQGCPHGRPMAANRSRQPKLSLLRERLPRHELFSVAPTTGEECSAPIRFVNFARAGLLFRSINICAGGTSPLPGQICGVCNIHASFN